MTDKDNEVVGVWEVNAPDAPFAWHVMTFTPYGTMSQSNPHAGNPDESDSSGHGVWEERRGPDGNTRIVGKFVEFKADHKTGQYIGKGEIWFDFMVDGDNLSGTSAAYKYNAEGECIKGPLASPIHGTRIVFTAPPTKVIHKD